MRKTQPCVVCGKMTACFLFEDESLGVPICSKTCEHQYIDRLPPETKEQIDALHSLDNKIEESKKRNRISWGASGLGLILVVAAFVTAGPTLLIGGALIAGIGAFSTRYYENKMYQLNNLRKRIVI